MDKLISNLSASLLGGALLILALIILAIVFLIVYFYRMKKKQEKSQNIDYGFEESFAVLRTIIKTEISSFDNDLLYGDVAITNAQFDNYYHTLTDKILEDLSPNLVKHLSMYMSETMVYKIIAKEARIYLISKIKNVEYTEE